MKWEIELSEHHIHYKPGASMKGQTIFDFIVEFTSTKKNLSQVEAEAGNNFSKAKVEGNPCQVKAEANLG